MFLAKKTVLSGIEKESLSKIIHYHNSLIKHGTLDPERMLDFCCIGMAISPKIFQHFITITYPKFEMPLELIKRKMPLIIFKSHEKLQWDQTLSAIGIHLGSRYFPYPYKGQGQIISLENKTTLITSKESQAYQNTKQQEPDFLYEYKHENGILIWSRYFDWKTGEISPNNGHILGTSDPKLYEQLTEDLLIRQQKYFFNDPILGPFLQKLLKKTDISWTERGQLFHKFLQEKFQYLSQNINPSVILKTENIADIISITEKKTYKIIEASLTIKSLEDKDSTEKAIVNIFKIYDKKTLKDIIKNYESTQGHSSQLLETCKKLWTEFL